MDTFGTTGSGIAAIAVHSESDWARHAVGKRCDVCAMVTYALGELLVADSIRSLALSGLRVA